MIALDPTDTIAASATPPGGGVRGLVRVTGPRAFGVALAGFEPLDQPPADPPGWPRPERRAGRLRVDGLRRPLAVEVNGWPGARTYTGQPLVEVATPGAPAVVRAVLQTFLARGARLAEPGEFTLRAFLAGRIDLTQAEAVLGVIDAVSPAQLDGALRQLAGGLARPIRRLRDDLADALAHLEANLDFADEADVDPLGRVELARTLDRQAAAVADLAGRLDGRARAAGRPRVVLIGPPNAGKSRLFNALLGRDRAIVAPVAGTTRDYLEAECPCDGLLVDLVDTAGRETAVAPIARLAQDARAGQAGAADLLLDCRPVGAPDDGAASMSANVARIKVGTKADVGPEGGAGCFDLVTSAATGRGVAMLRAAIAGRLREGGPGGHGEGSASTTARSAEGLASAARSLAAAAAAVAARHGDELVAVDLRQAVDDLGRVVGAVITDDLLDRIFRRFCIGK